jgi:hypothetical protein
MATGITALSKTLIGVEASPGGTTDTPTTHWRGEGKIKDRRETVFAPERVGILGGTTRTYVPRTGSEVTLEGDAKFSQLAYVFNAGVKAVDPTTDSSSAKIRTWTVQWSSTDLYASTDLDTLVVENGDNTEVQVARFVFFKEFSLSGAQGEAVQVSALGEGRAPSTSASFTTVGTTDLSNDSETILVSKGYLYIDASSGTIGTTAKSETLLSFNLKHTTGWVALPAKDGRLDFSTVKHIDDEITLDVTFEHNSVATAEKDAWKNQTERAIRLKFTGAALSSTDTYDSKTAIIDLWGKWQTFGAEGLEEQDGDNIYRGTFKAGYSATAGNKARYILVTEQSALP